MKKTHSFTIFLAALFAAASCGLALATPAALIGDAEQIIVDVRDGRFISGEHEYTLAEEVRPITVRVDEGIISADVSIPGFVITLELGYGVLAVTQQAAPYITVVDSATQTLMPWDETELCPICGQSVAIGRHYQLECGHQGCLMTVDHPTTCTECNRYLCNGKDHSICEYCDVAWCVHVDIECPYTRNPAPTPFVISPEGETPVYFYLDPNGASIVGDYTLMNATKAPTNYGWNPGLSFAATASPTQSADTEVD